MTDHNLLTINNLSISYGDTKAVDNVSFDIGNGEIVGIVGESGSGKTTILRSILSLLDANGKITNGSIKLTGRDILSMSAKKRTKIAGKEISMIFQNSEKSLDATQTIGKQFIECIKAHQKCNKTQSKALAERILSQLNLKNTEQIWQSYPFELSGGMCQRAAIAMAMVNNPQLLLADEPTSALDSTVQAQTVKSLLSLRKETNTAILIVSHNMGVIAHMSDFIGVMYSGRLVEWGKKEEVLFDAEHPYTKSLLGAIPNTDQNYQNVNLFDDSSYKIKNNKHYYSETHWVLETEPNE